MTSDKAPPSITPPQRTTPRGIISEESCLKQGMLVCSLEFLEEQNRLHAPVTPSHHLTAGHCVQVAHESVKENERTPPLTAACPAVTTI